jgi:hypothetical protein
MSYTEFLRTKMASQQKIVAVQRPMDASFYTQRQRMAATQTFFKDGSSVGTITKQTDRPVNNNASNAYSKRTGRPPAASEYTSYVGSTPSLEDKEVRNRGGIRELLCVQVPDKTESWNYPNASMVTKQKVACPSERGAPISDVKFVDNTISLSAMHPRMVSECCDHKIETPNHQHSSGIQVDVNNQPYAIGKPFFMANPPKAQGPNVSDHKVGGFLGNRSTHVPTKHGFVKPTNPVPIAPGGQGQNPAHLRINQPTLFNIKST